jgi:parallel beta-helix repeat protein
MYVYAGSGQLTVTGTTIQQNGSDGLLAYGSNVFVANSAFTGNFGAGLDLVYCTGTVDGNQLSSSQTSYNYGDGLQITGGNTTVKNNIFESNQEAAIYLTASSSDAVVHITGNKMRQNSSYGIFSDSFASVIAEGNLLKSNGGGIYLFDTPDAHLVNNIISNSTDSSIGDGVEIDGGSNARITNNTIFQNSLYGVLLTSGVVSVDNSIVYGNTGGELQGVLADSVRSSLVGAEPKFVNPGSDDFSLAAGSAAIDTGSNAAADLPFVDYYGKLRVSSAATLPGQGTVDAGAVESDSAYPLVYPLAVHGSDSALGGNFHTGIVFVNPNSTADQVGLTAFGEAGGLLAGSQNPTLVSLNAEAQVPIFDYQLFGLDSNGSSREGVLGYSSQKADGFFLVMDSGFRKFATGANASTRLSNKLVFMRHLSDSNKQTRYIIFNPGNNSANVSATLYDAAGASIGQPKTAVIAAKAHSVIQFSSAVTSGYVRVESDRPVSGVELVGNENVEAALGAASPGSQARLFFPHFAVGDHYSTQVGIVNTGSSSTVLELSAFDGNGNLIGSVDPLTLVPGGQLLKTITELFGIPAEGPLQTGYLIAQADQPGISGFTDFRYTAERDADTSIPADSTPSRRLLFSHIAHGVSAGTGVPYQTGIALLNPYGTAVAYTIRVYDGAGTLVAQADQTIGPHQKLAKYLSYPIEGVGFFLRDMMLRNGHVEVTSDYGLIGLEIFFTDDVSQLAGVPAQVGD